MLALIVINLFTPLIFSIGDDNVYVRGPLIVMPYAVTFGYLIYAELLVYTNRNNARRYLFLPSIIFFLPIFVAAIIQMLFYGISITWPAVAISLVSIYINIQCEFSAVDPLSGVYTRQYLDAHLRRIAKKQEPMVGIMFDLDRFKSINDTYGHQMGDSAIRQMGLILRNVCASDDVVSRYGGDEFVALRPAATPEAAQELIAQIQQEVQRFNATTEYPFRLSVSAGLCSFDPTLDSVDEFLSRMDASLYTNKRERAKQLPNRRAGNGTAHPNVE
jgi:diguanylate cyclase (GGDEF)-like protein